MTRFSLISALAAGLALAAPALAQGPPAYPGAPPFGGGGGYPGGPPPGFGGPPPGFGGPPPGFQGGPYGGPGGGGGQRPPFAAGVVNAVDAGAHTLTMTGRSGTPQTINIDASAQIYTQATVPVSDLAVGDQVQVQGMPTAMTASSVTAGQDPFAVIGGPPPGGGPGGGGPGGPGGPPPAGQATVTGKVKSVSPLTLTLSDTATLVLKMAPGAKITRIKKEALGDVKANDRIIATGEAGADGTLNATTVAVNMTVGRGFGGGRGGFGGGQFGGGQGGFGGGQFGGRGFGGGRGGGQFGGGQGGFGGGQFGGPPAGGPPPGRDD